MGKSVVFLSLGHCCVPILSQRALQRNSPNNCKTVGHKQENTSYISLLRRHLTACLKEHDFITALLTWK
jgi:hypothetical protein